MEDVAYVTAAQAEALVDRIGVGESGKVPFGAPNRSGATVDIREGESVLTREATDRFVLRTQWHEWVPGHGYGGSWEEVETLDRAEVARQFTNAQAPIGFDSNGDWRAIRWPRQY